MNVIWEFIGQRSNGIVQDMAVPISKITVILNTVNDTQPTLILDNDTAVIVCGFTFRECVDAYAANRRLPTDKERARQARADAKAIAALA